MRPPNTLSPDQIAQLGQEIYDRDHRADLEQSKSGHFAVVDVGANRVFTDERAEMALRKAQEAGAVGPFHLLRVGAPGAFRVSFHSDADCEGLSARRMSLG